MTGLQSPPHTASSLAATVLPPARIIPVTAIATARARLRAIPHPPEHYDGIPYYDHELDMPQSTAHGQMIHDFGQFLYQVATATGLRVFSDNPIWYWLEETEEQKPYYPDYALADPVDPARATARDLRLAVELVSTASAAKERKDRVRMRALNAANGVPEFLLLYPEPDDDRAVEWFGLDAASGTYRQWPLPVDRRYRSQSIPGLEIEVLPRLDWQPGRKVRLWYRGERLPTVDEAVCQADQATHQVEQAIVQAKQERREREMAQRQADQERREREMTQRQADQERREREMAERQADQERREREMAQRQAKQALTQAEQMRAENERLLARLREAGLTP
jgi:hypothetical protein